jgi:copper chaperone CopZ
METAQFSIPLLSDDRQALDLGNVLTAVKGVASVHSDVRAHTVSVVYDADFTSRTALEGLIEDAGYPLGDGQ